MADVTKLVIERDRWIRGTSGPEPGEQSCLFRLLDHKMCCLGFFARSCGIHFDEIADEAEPEDVPDAGWPSWVLDATGDDESVRFKNSDDIRSLISANDDEQLSGAAREARIAELFAKHGVEVEFR